MVTVPPQEGDEEPCGGYSIPVQLFDGASESLYLDNGSAVSLLAERAVPEGVEVKRVVCPFTLYAFTGGEVRPTGTVIVPVAFTNERHTLILHLTFWLCDDSHFEGRDIGLLGNPWFRSHRVRTYYEMLEIEVRGERFAVMETDLEEVARVGHCEPEASHEGARGRATESRRSGTDVAATVAPKNENQGEGPCEGQASRMTRRETPRVKITLS